MIIRYIINVKHDILKKLLNGLTHVIISKDEKEKKTKKLILEVLRNFDYDTTNTVRSHIGSERPEPGPYKCMLTLTSKTRFGTMRGCQEQIREGNLGGSPGHGWTGRPKTDNILLVRWGVTNTIKKILKR